MTTRTLALPDWAVRSLDEQRLTQWRVPLKVQPPEWCSDGAGFSTFTPDGHVEFRGQSPEGYGSKFIKLPFVSGQLRWVQETWARVPRTAYLHSDGIEQAGDPSDSDMAAIYKHGFGRCCGGFGWRSPVTMPRWASRWTLTVESVRVCRLWDAPEADAKAEGHYPSGMDDAGRFYDPATGEGGSYRAGYATHWSQRHYWRWQRNDWCAVATWRAERRNVDA